MVPQGLLYTKEHEWIKVDGDSAVIGITNHAQDELGDITFIELPGKGDSFKVSDSIATIESVKAASDIYAPVSCEVIEVNSALEDAPEAINDSAYENGWICKVKVNDPSELEGLMTAEAYTEYLGSI